MKKIYSLIISLIFQSGMLNAQWYQTTINSGEVRCIASDGINIFAGTGLNGVYLSTDSGNNWKTVNNGLTDTTIFSLAVKDNNIYAGTNGGGVFLSTDNGNSWTAINNGLTGTSIQSLTISGNKIFAGTNNGIFLSINNGNLWSDISGNLPITQYPYVISSAIIDNTIFVGTDNGVYISENNGGNWSQANNGLPHTSFFSIAISGNNIFASTQGEVYLSVDMGNSWTAVNSGLPFSDIRSLVISGSIIFAGINSGGGVLLSSNDGSSWTDLGGGNVWSLAISGNNIFAGTIGGGLWKRSLTPLYTASGCFANYTTAYDTIQNTFTLIVDSTTTAFAITYHWDFGDGNTSTLATPTHIYTVDTVYNVCLKITTASNDTCSYCHKIGKDYLGHIYRTNGFTINVINSYLQTGVSSILSNENSFIVYPNPTSGLLQVQSLKFKVQSLKIYNVFGECVYQNIITSANQQIDLSSQPNGIYFLHVKTEQGTVNKKIIVSH